MNDSANRLDSDTESVAKKSSKALWITLILLLAISGGAYYLWQLLNTTIAQQQSQLQNLQQQLSRTQDVVQQHDKQIITAAKHVPYVGELHATTGQVFFSGLLACVVALGISSAWLRKPWGLKE